MVLPASAAHDEPRAGEAGWIEQIRLTLGLTDDGILVHVDRARPERLGDLVRGLLTSFPDLSVHDDVRVAEDAPDGSAWVLLPKAADADWLNLRRPVFARRKLKVVLFCNHDTTLELMQRAPDFFDWISHQEVCPEGIATHAVLGIRCALAAQMHVAWAGPGTAADLERIAITIAAAQPGGALRWVAPEGDYAALVDAVQSAGETWVGCRVRAMMHLRRFRWALAEVHGFRRALAVVGDLACPGFFPVHDRLAPFAEARAALEASGCSRAGCVAALAGLEPEAIELASDLARGGMGDERLVELLATASDPGAALAWERYGAGGPPLESLMLSLAPPPVMRAFILDPHVRAALDARLMKVAEATEAGLPATNLELGTWAVRGQVPQSIKQVARSVDALAFSVEAMLRGFPSAKRWAELAEQALVVGDPGPAGVWAMRALKAGARLHGLAFVGDQLIALRDPRGERLQAAIEIAGHAGRPTTRWRPLLLKLTPWLVLIVATVVIAGGPDYLLVVSVVFGLLLFAVIPYMIALVLGRILSFFAQAPRHPPYPPQSSVFDMAAKLAGRVRHALVLVESGAYYEEAVRELEDLLGSAEVGLGIEHPVFRRGLALLARARAEQGEDKKAMEALSGALVLEGRLAGVAHAPFAELVMVLAGVFANTGRSREAELLLRKLLGPSVPEMPQADSPPAIEQSSEVGELLQRFLSRPETPDLSEQNHASAMRLLCRALVAQGRYSDAETLLRRALDGIAVALPPNDPERFRLLAALGSVLAMRGRHEDALDALHRAEAAGVSAVGKRHIDVARILRDIARLQHRQKRPGAGDAARRALAIFTEVAPSTPETDLARNELAPIAAEDSARG